MLLGKVGFADPDQRAWTPSPAGGASGCRSPAQLVAEPDLLLLDEPTNHLDLEGILWLEKLLTNAPFAFLLVSHDRYFLENVTNRVVELNRAYADGYLSINGTYSDFLVEARGVPGSPGRPAAVAGRPGAARDRVAAARRQGPHHQGQGAHRAGRADDAGPGRAQGAQRRRRAPAKIDFVATGRQTRKLLTAKKVAQEPRRPAAVRAT